MRKLKDLAARAGRWIGLGTSGAAPPAATTAVRADRFDEETWQDVLTQATALRDLAAELGERHDYAGDLIRDTFLAAYKVTPEVRDRSEMDPARTVNHQIITGMLASPEFTELRRQTAGDEYAAAMAVLAQAEQLRTMTERARQAQQAAEAAAEATQAARHAGEQVQQALDAAAALAADGGDGQDGDVPPAAAQAVEDAITAATQAGQAAGQAEAEAAAALAAAEPALAAAARKGAGQAAGQAREEAALMDAWGADPGELQRMSFGQRSRLAARLRSGRLAQFASLIGRFRRMAEGELARKVEGVPGELTGVTMGSDLSRLIPSEMAALAIPAMRAAFAARLAENRLYVYQTAGDEQMGKGAIIALLDSSASMATAHAGGITREAWSKALALALLHQARAEKRDMVAIHFGSAAELKVFRFPAASIPPIGDVIDMAEWFFSGGTDFEAPLAAAADLLDAEFNADGKQKGDVVIVTDGVCQVSEEFLAAWRERKARTGFRLWGVELAARPSATLDALCDNVRDLDDLTEPGAVRDMFRVI